MAEIPKNFEGFWHRAGVRVGVTFVVFLCVTAATGLLGSWLIAPSIGWIVAAGAFSTWFGLTLFRLGPEDTATHAIRDDPSRSIAHTLLIVASLASFGAVGLLLIESGTVRAGTAVVLAAAALATVAVSWILVHVLFTLRYAAIYHRDDGTGVDFNQTEPPGYADFAYVAFTLGMTYQVSDTTLTSNAMRRAALGHALLSFLLGVVVLASIINLVASMTR